MESQQVHVDDASRPALGFPLGTALLLMVIFGLSGVFSCYYHWDKFRSLRRRFFSTPHPPSKPTPPSTDLKQNQSQSLPVLMPGDRVPKFIALPSPREPTRVERVVVEVQNPPYKPPRSTIPVPMYI